MLISNKKQNIFTKIGTLSLFFVLIFSFLVINKTKAAAIIDDEIKTYPTSAVFKGHISYTYPETSIPNIYYYFFENGAINETINSNKVKLKTSGSPSYNFILQLGDPKTNPLMIGKEYFLVITDADSIGKWAAGKDFKISGKWTIKTTTNLTATESSTPTVTTEIAKSIESDLTLFGKVSNNNNPSSVWFKIGTKENNLSILTAKQEMKKNGQFSALFNQYRTTDIKNNSTVYYQACAKNTKGENCGEILNFESGLGRENIPSTQTQQQNITPPKDTKTDTVYTPLAPLPDPDTGELKTSFDTKDSCAFGTYLNIIIKIFFGICAALAMLMIIIGGIQYMTSELMSSKESAKESITHAIFGFLLALSAYLILNTLNPDLLNACLNNLPKAEITIIEPLSSQQERVSQNLANNKVFKRTKYYNNLKTLVGNKYPHCIMQATIQIESGGNTNSQIIGHDENVKNSQIKSRRDFISSGKKSSGATFTPTSNAKDPIQNDDGRNSSVAPKPNELKLGLDLRFSHSVGMFGITFFPPNGTITDGSNFTMQQIYNNTNNADLKWAVNHAEKAYNYCGKDPQKVFYYWGAGGNCSTPKAGSWNAVISAQKMDLYNQCLKQDN